LINQTGRPWFDRGYHEELKMKTNRFGMALASVLVGAGLILPQGALSHCDTMDGPVVAAAGREIGVASIHSILLKNPGGYFFRRGLATGAAKRNKRRSDRFNNCHCTASPPSKSRAAAKGSGMFT
jgi:hypothetical protein